jgi:hypothetical protein
MGKNKDDDARLNETFVNLHLASIEQKYPGLMAAPEAAAAVRQIIAEITQSAERYVAIRSFSEITMLLADIFDQDLKRLRETPLPKDWEARIKQNPHREVVAYTEVTYVAIADVLTDYVVGVMTEAGMNGKAAAPVDVAESKSEPSLITWTSRDRGQA